ncbi:hypothetical protein BCR34DRAFT_606023 [Clohesyomyces aquaticus]|uniref:Uncharacterized protein n=1 Tax=Clohesyomyces aquaticus TaxID=1231657 RepID=A0A1Y1YT93_9PLEO|nr:hypothetical protein BCR34DRAFT_606023 [Clohesyomyces aquaticus]
MAPTALCFSSSSPRPSLSSLSLHLILIPLRQNPPLPILRFQIPPQQHIPHDGNRDTPASAKTAPHSPMQRTWGGITAQRKRRPGCPAVDAEQQQRALLRRRRVPRDPRDGQLRRNEGACKEQVEGEAALDGPEGSRGEDDGGEADDHDGEAGHDSLVGAIAVAGKEV